MTKDKDYEKRKQFDLKFKEKHGIVDNITYRSDTYPPKFYQVLEKLDIVMRLWAGDEMGTSGYDELLHLCGTIGFDSSLYWDMPPSARAFFMVLINPKNQWNILQEKAGGFGDMYRAYADLRQYLIDNKERVTNAYLRYMEGIERSWKEE